MSVSRSRPGRDRSRLRDRLPRPGTLAATCGFTGRVAGRGRRGAPAGSAGGGPAGVWVAATATGHTASAGMIAFLVLAGVAGYVAACAFWPFTACRRCSGAGKFRSPSGKAWRSCRRCKGSGRRVRYGRRVYEWARGIERDAR